jgi:hypothetical protein
MNNKFPEWLFDLIYFPDADSKWKDLKIDAEEEDWGGIEEDENGHVLPMLHNYLSYTYKRLAQQGKIEISKDGQYLSFNTGLVSRNQEPIFCYCSVNRNEGASQPWFFNGWKKKGEYVMTSFDDLPEMAEYIDDPSVLIMDFRMPLRVHVAHIIADNKDRFPDKYKGIEDFMLQNIVNGAIDNAKERIKRNYKTAIPQFYNGKVQLLIPLCLSSPNIADLAIVVEKHDTFYRASSCLSLDKAYGNARLLAKPDRDWLLPNISNLEKKEVRLLKEKIDVLEKKLDKVK